jgi:hypothetical protein
VRRTLREVEAGNREQARAEANAALKLAPNRDVRAVGALALARAGDTAAAEKLAAELDKTFPLGTLVQRYWLPTVQAGVALERQDPNRAIELLKVASTVEFGSTKADLTMQGDTAKARTAYQDFLTLWKDADPDVPVLREAKAEYAKLR